MEAMSREISQMHSEAREHQRKTIEDVEAAKAKVSVLEGRLTAVEDNIEDINKTVHENQMQVANVMSRLDRGDRHFFELDASLNEIKVNQARFSGAITRMADKQAENAVVTTKNTEAINNVATLLGKIEFLMKALVGIVGFAVTIVGLYATIKSLIG